MRVFPLVPKVLALSKVADLARDRARSSRSWRARTHEFQERFLAILGHDLRNPLAAISMGAALLRQTAVAGDLKILTRIDTSALRMSRMIEQILDLTRSRLAGGLEIVPAPVDLGEVLTQVVEELRIAHPARPILLRCPSPLVANVDRDRIEQVFSNLVGNAIDHGLAGTPVTIEASANGIRGAEVVVRIHNQGPPIPEELHAKLFDPFRRGSRDSRTSLTSGLGLGLYISREIVDGHGGTLVAASTSADGTTFTVGLPQSTPNADGAQ
jgi:sigma-B regulation protein RsbU (phosphoserine phosphatase)